MKKNEDMEMCIYVVGREGEERERDQGNTLVADLATLPNATARTSRSNRVPTLRGS